MFPKIDLSFISLFLNVVAIGVLCFNESFGIDIAFVTFRRLFDIGFSYPAVQH